MSCFRGMYVMLLEDLYNNVYITLMLQLIKEVLHYFTYCLVASDVIYQLLLILNYNNSLKCICELFFCITHINS